MKQLFYLISLLFACNPVVAQEWKPFAGADAKELMKPVFEIYSRPDYQFRFERALYINASDPSAYMVEKGSFAHGKGSEYRTESGGQLLIQNSDAKLVIVDKDSSVLIFAPDTLFSPVSGFALNPSEDLYRYEHTSSGTLHKLRIITLREGTGIDRMELWVNTSTYTIVKVIATLSAGNYVMDDINDQTLEQPLTVISYQPLEPLKERDHSLFEHSSWIIKQDGTLVLHPDKQPLYELEDLRYNPTQH